MSGSRDRERASASKAGASTLGSTSGGEGARARTSEGRGTRLAGIAARLDAGQGERRGSGGAPRARHPGRATPEGHGPRAAEHGRTTAAGPEGHHPPTTPTTPAPTPPTVAAAPVITSRAHATPPGGQPDTRRAVGVGERMTFTSTVAGAWRAGANASPADSTTFEWTAPDTAQNVNVTCTAASQTGSLTIQVVAPSWVTAENAGDLDVSGHRHARAGMKARFVYHPMHVSFAGIEAREEQGPPTNIYGYWLRSSASTLYHWPGGTGRNGEFIGLNERNRDAGWDEVSRYGCRGPWPQEGGGFDWVIPVFYRLAGGGPERRAGTIVQYHRMEADGTIRLRKGDAFVRGERPS